MESVTLTDVMSLVGALVLAESEVEDAERILKEKSARARFLREESIPLIMLELGLTTLVLSSGETLKIKDEVYASIPKDNWPAVVEWLTKTDNDGLIKSELSVLFGRGEKKKAQALFQQLLKKGLNPVLDEAIHAQTLKAFIKERLRAALPIDLDLFGARSTSEAIISKPKKGVTAL